MKELDGGQLDMPEISCMKAVLQICDDNDLDSTSLRHAPMSMIETLQEAAYQQMQAETSQMTASSPVSYTHLDVYKRQVLWSIRSNGTTLCWLSVSGCSVVPVSWTVGRKRL